MSSIIEELRTSKRQLIETFDLSRRHATTNVPVADNNNNDNYYNVSSQIQTSAAGGLFNRWRLAPAPVSSAAPQRTSQSRSKSRRGRAELCYDHYGALDLTSAKKAARASSTASRQPSVLLSSAAMNLVTDHSVPLDLSVRSRVRYVLIYVSLRQNYTRCLQKRDH